MSTTATDDDVATYHLAHRAVITVSGIEATDFLNNLITIDVAKLADNEVSAACLLTPQGRILFDFLISPEGDGFLIETDMERRDALLTKLMLYKLRRPITITAADHMIEACVGSTKRNEGWRQDKRFKTAVWRRYGKASKKNFADISMYHAFRYRHTIAEGAGELIPEAALPLEAGFDRWGGVSFDKGCFVGQEVTARIHYKGLSKRLYASAHLTAMVKPPVDVRSNGKIIGEVLGATREGAEVVALIAIRQDADHANAMTAAAVTGEDVAVTLTATQS